MKFEIKHRWTGEVLFSLEAESFNLCVEAAVKKGINLSWSNLSGSNLSWSDLSGSDLSWSNLSGSDLSGSDLSGSDLSGSNLSRSNLSGSDLSGSDLSWSNLSGSNLSGVKGIHYRFATPLALLLDQQHPLVAYKLVNEKGEGPFNGGIKYEVGGEYSVQDFDANIYEQCGKGINLATLDWCMKEWRMGYKIFKAEFNPSDIVAVPFATDGKFRVKACRIIGEADLKELGLVKEEKSEIAEAQNV